MTRQAAGTVRRAERGSFSLELAVLAPALLLIISFIISVGRVTEGRALVQGAARDAARAATINHAGNAATAARAAFTAATRNADCDALVLDPLVPQPGGTVRATVRCRFTTLWGKQTVERTAMSAVDIYRGTD
jgi:Flp pilus assembly protein TadG